MDPHRFIMIACAVLARECYACAAFSTNIIDLKIIQQGLHDIGEAKMSASLQDELDAIDQEKYEAILLGYGLCNNGIRNLRSSIPLIVPRAHDCITLLMGSKDDFLDYFNEHPGSYYRSTGWQERATSHLSNPDSTTRQMGMGTYEEYVEKYGEENAKYLMEVLGDQLRNYSELTYIDTQIPGSPQARQEALQMAEEHGWTYTELEGNTRLLQKLMDGQWDESEFLVVEPGKTIEPSYDDAIILEL
jgi:hypothetical protein